MMFKTAVINEKTHFNYNFGSYPIGTIFVRISYCRQKKNIPKPILFYFIHMIVMIMYTDQKTICL